MNSISLFECTCAQQFSNRPFSLDDPQNFFEKKIRNNFYNLKSQINHFEDECNLGPFETMLDYKMSLDTCVTQAVYQ